MTKGKKRFYIDDGKSGGDYEQKEPRLDIEGVPFSTPTYYLPHWEYTEVCSAITDCYEAFYKGKPFAKKSMNNKTYYFENRRKGDYNIYRVTDDDE